ncbi:MAG: hypothetical protein WCQ64_07140 [Acidobacteriota bacterium]
MSRTSPLPLRLLLLGALVVVAPACGKRGPPLPPLRPAPDRVTDLAIVRREQDVTLRFSTPVRNVDGSEPLLFDRVEIYAMTVPAGAVRLTPEQIVRPVNRVGVLGKPAPAAPTAGDEADAPVATPLSLVEKVATVIAPPVATPAVPTPVVTPASSTPTAASAASVPPGASGAPPAPVTLAVATRFYVVVPYANRTRAGRISDVLAVPLGPVPVAPHDAKIAYDEQTLTLTWVAGVTGQSFHVYDANATSIEAAKPLTTSALTTAEFKQPVVFGKRVCFNVRGVRVTAAVTMESAPSTAVCETPADTFPPAAPGNVTAFAASGAITLTWDAVTAADLAGYIVLRGEGTGDRLQPLTPSPVSGTSFTDATTKAGVRYIYAVVAVDNATRANRSKESNRVEETGR